MDSAVENTIMRHARLSETSCLASAAPVASTALAPTLSTANVCFLDSKTLRTDVQQSMLKAGLNWDRWPPENPSRVLALIVDLSAGEKQVREALSAASRYLGSPMIFALASWDQLLSGSALLDLPIDDIVFLPAQPGELDFRFKRLASLIHDHQTVQHGKAGRNGFVLDLQSHTLNYAGRKVDLTKRECELISYLLSKPGQTISRAAIESDVWRHRIRVDSFDNVLNVHITRLRKKLKEIACDSMLTTDRGAGICLEVPSAAKTTSII